MTPRIGLYSPWDLTDPRAWSGAAHQMAEALAAVADVEIVPPVRVEDAPLERARTRVRGTRGRRSLPRHTMATARRRSQALNQALETRIGPSLDALVAIAGSTDVLRLPASLPLVQVTDATFPAICGFYPMATGLGRRGEREGERVEHASAARTDRWVVASQWAADSLVADVGVPASAVRVAPFGPGVTPTSAPRVRRPQRPMRVLVVIADWQRKRGDVVVDAVQQARRHADIELTIVGHAPDDLPIWVHLEGVVQSDRLSVIYAEHDVLLDLASANAAGVVMTDALASGLPVIATRVGGVATIVQDGQTGWLVDADRAAQQAADQLRLLTESGGADQIAAASKAAAEDAARRLTWRSWASAAMESVEDAVASHASAERRIVMISPLLPSAENQETAGEKLVRQTVDTLTADGARVTLVSAPGPANRRAIMRGGVPDHRLLSPARRITGRAARLLDLAPVLSPADLAPVRGLLQTADVVDLQWEESGMLLPALRLTAPAARTVVTLHDVLSQRFARQRDLQLRPERRAVWEARRRTALAVERLILAMADDVVVLSEKDAALLSSRGRARVHVVPPPIPGSPRPERSDLQPTAEPRLLFVGFMARWANEEGMHWFVTEVLPRIRAELPGARMAVAGGGLRDHVVEELENSEIEVLGFVEDLEALYNAADVVVVPLLSGAGVKFKVVEALVRGVPVVTTSVGNEGIHPADAARVADDPQDFANAVLDVVRYPQIAESHTRAHAPAVAEEFGVAGFRQRIEEIYQ